MHRKGETAMSTTPDEWLVVCLKDARGIPTISGLHDKIPNPLRTITDVFRSTTPEVRILGYHLAPDNMDKSPQTASVEMELCRKIHRLWLRAIDRLEISA